jgi:hypothetical protein
MVDPPVKGKNWVKLLKKFATGLLNGKVTRF